LLNNNYDSAAKSTNLQFRSGSFKLLYYMYHGKGQNRGFCSKINYKLI